jgi:DNA-binding MarR family transcriptional regulator
MQLQILPIHHMSLQKLRRNGKIAPQMGTAMRDLAGSASDRVDMWRDLMDRYARTVSALERRLEEEHGLGVSEYEVLERLAAPDKQQRRMQELAEAVHLSQSALSRVVGRLEADGLVTRGMCAHDRRGIYACLTDAGRARYEAARPTHRAVLADTLG